MPNFVKLSRTVSKLWSGHNVQPLTDGRIDGRTDTQKFGGYNIIPRHFLWRGIKKVKNFKAYFLAWQQTALKSLWVRIMVFGEKMVCIHNSENAVIRMNTV